MLFAVVCSLVCDLMGYGFEDTVSFTPGELLENRELQRTLLRESSISQFTKNGE